MKLKRKSLVAIFTGLALLATLMLFALVPASRVGPFEDTELRAAKKYLRDNTPTGDVEVIRWWPATSTTVVRDSKLDALRHKVETETAWIANAREDKLETEIRIRDVLARISKIEDIRDQEIYESEMQSAKRKLDFEKMKLALAVKRIKQGETLLDHIGEVTSSIKTEKPIRVCQIKFRTTISILGKLVYHRVFIVDKNGIRPPTPHESESINRARVFDEGDWQTLTEIEPPKEQNVEAVVRGLLHQK